MASILTTTRIERVCEQCGKTIHPGELYLNRPRTKYPIRCQDCYNETYSLWKENVKNHRDKWDDLISLLREGPITDDDIKELTGNRYRSFVKQLYSSGLNISITKKDGVIYYELIEETDNSDDLLDDLDYLTIISILNYLLIGTSYKIDNNQILISGRFYQISLKRGGYDQDGLFIIDYDGCLLCGTSDNMAKFSDYFSVDIPVQIDNILSALLGDA